MSFEKIKGKLGFGCMRLKMNEDKVDYDEFNKMIDAFIGAGFNYFDTAHGYIDGKSETAMRDCLSARYNREDFVFANKLSVWCFKSEEDILPLFENQLECCGVDYFDFYLIHCVTKDTYKKYEECNCFEFIKQLKEQGRVKHIGFSFHDNAEFLDEVLTKYPFVEFVQLQFNYLDYDDPGVQSKECYDVAVKHGKKVIVMEPVRGGALANLPEKAALVLDELGGGSHASYALRYAASFPEVFMVLSGMGSTDMMNDNINTFTDFVPLSEREFEATDKVREIIRQVRQLPCTSCRYCTEVCEKDVPIPEIFEVYNKHLAAKTTFDEAKSAMPKGANDCIKCGKCEKNCPQSIEIRKHLEKIAEWEK